MFIKIFLSLFSDLRDKKKFKMDLEIETNDTNDQDDETEMLSVNLEPIVEIDENIDLGIDNLKIFKIVAS